jgi:HK97 family phage prohead protease
MANTASNVRIQRTEDGKPGVIDGYGAVFFSEGDAGTEYELASWGGYTILERIMPGAFDRAIRERDDARGLFNHDANQILGRVSSGTMRLSVDSRGLKYEIDVPDTQAGRDVATSIERGDLSGSSFAFVPRKIVWVEEDERDIRQIEDLTLYDAGPVTYPAYEATSTGVRSEDFQPLKAEWEEWRKHSKRQSKGHADYVAMRLRMMELDAAFS